jgi:hypothetical protein
MNANTIKARVKKANPEVTIMSVKKFGWGVFSVKVKKELKRTTKVGIIMGKWNGGNVELDKVEWV